MTKSGILIFATFLILASSAGAQILPDAQGRTVHGPSHRVIALSPALTELIFAMNLQDKLVGVSEYSDFPEGAKQKTPVGPYTKPNMEKILDLRPDLVILPVEGPEDIERRLDQIHVPFAVVDMRHIDDIGTAAAQVATWLGNAEAGKKFQNQWKQDLKHLFAKKSQTTCNVFVEIQRNPLMAVGKDTFIDEIVSRCGGVNITKESGYPRISKESLLLQNIDLVLLANFFPTPSEKQAALETWTTFPSTRNGRILILDPDATTRPGPRLLKGIKTICEAISNNRKKNGKAP